VVLLLFLALPVVASIITWAMLQFLPRTNEVPWAISSRLSTLVIVLIASILLTNAIEMTLGARLFKEEMLLGLLCAGALIDGRCFISADRYPRVGLWRTVMTLVMFSAPACLADSLVGNRYELVASLGCVSAVVVSIQLLAPMHVRLVNGQTNKGSRHGPKDVTQQADGDQARSDIEVNVVQEQV
jgi:hypothetical protein